MAFIKFESKNLPPFSDIHDIEILIKDDSAKDLEPCIYATCNGVLACKNCAFFFTGNSDNGRKERWELLHRFALSKEYLASQL